MQEESNRPFQSEARKPRRQGHAAKFSAGGFAPTSDDNRPMFQPSQHDVRRFFCAIWRKMRERLPLEPLEAHAAEWIAEHPEYHDMLGDEGAALAADYRVEAGRENPFLHLAMHLSLVEQAGIDQPSGVRPALQALARRTGSLHAAHHEAMECLGEMIWRSQRSGLPPDGEAYLDCLRRRAALGPSPHRSAAPDA